MTVLSPDALALAARAEAERLLTDLLAVPVTVEAGEGTVSWQPTRRRFIHGQVATIVRRFDTALVEVGPAGQILRFADENRLSAEVGHGSLLPSELLTLASTSGLLGPSARIEATEPGALPTIVVVQDEAPRRTRFVLHPTLRLLAAFEVIEEGPA